MAENRLSAVEELLAREHIKETKHKYFRAVDALEPELLRETLTDDVYINFGPMGQFKGLDAYMEVTHLGMSEPSMRGLHHALNPEINFISEAEAECYWVTYFMGYDSAKNSYLQQSGNYFDRYRLEGGCWKIYESNYTLWFHQANTMGAWTPLFPDGPITGEPT